MNTQAMVANPTEQITAGAVVDALRTLFHLKICRYQIKMVQDNNLLGIDEDKMEDTDRLLKSLINELKRRVPAVTGAEWMQADVSPDKLFMAATAVEMIAKIGVEEGEHYYEEFASMLFSLFDEVFYHQKHRKKIHFSKYKSIFDLIRSELRADIEHEKGTSFTGQFNYNSGNKSLWLRMSPVMVPSQIQSI